MQETQYDYLDVTGAAALVGTLQVSLVNNFTPSPGQTFEILTWGSRSGTFSTLELPALGGSLGWDTSQLYTSGVLSVAAVPEPESIYLMAIAAVTLIVMRRSIGRC